MARRLFVQYLWRLQKWNFGQYQHKFLAKVCSKCLQNKHSKICKSGKIMPNLVPLFCTQRFLKDRFSHMCLSPTLFEFLFFLSLSCSGSLHTFHSFISLYLVGTSSPNLKSTYIWGCKSRWVLFWCSLIFEGLDQKYFSAAKCTFYFWSVRCQSGKREWIIRKIKINGFKIVAIVLTQIFPWNNELTILNTLILYSWFVKLTYFAN